MKGVSNPFQPLFDSLNEINLRLISLEKATTKPVVVEKKKPVPAGYMDRKAAAAYLGVSPSFIQDRKDSGVLSFYTFGKLVRYKSEDLDKLGTWQEAKF